MAGSIKEPGSVDGGDEVWLLTSNERGLPRSNCEYIHHP